MKQLLYLFLLLVVFGCNKSKKEDLEKINQLEKEILRQQELISKQEQTIRSIEKLYQKNLKESETNVLKKIFQKDSILKALQFSTAIDATGSSNLSEYFGSIDYQPTSNDKYWKRGPYYSSVDSQEFFFNVRVSTYNDVFRVYFMGVQYPLKRGEFLVSIYELDEFKTIHRIDTIDMSLVEDFILGDDPEEAALFDHYFFEFALLQSDNLILKQGELFYYKSKELEELNSLEKRLTNKKFYKYNLGSKEKSTKINTHVLSNIIVNSPFDIINIHPNKSKVVNNLGEIMSFYKISDWNTQKQLIFTNNLYKNVDKIKFDLTDYIEFEEEGRPTFIDQDTGGSLLFGGTAWHTTKNILYFDNTGVTYRCIWQIDFDQKQVTKIVPEHEAIHPCFFKTNDKEYILYAEKNKIMISESPDTLN